MVRAGAAIDEASSSRSEEEEEEDGQKKRTVSILFLRSPDRGRAIETGAFSDQLLRLSFAEQVAEAESSLFSTLGLSLFLSLATFKPQRLLVLSPKLASVEIFFLLPSSPLSRRGPPQALSVLN